MNPGELLRELRESRNMSQEELSRGISTRSTLSSYENQTTDIPFKRLTQYLSKLNVRIDEFQYFLDLEATGKYTLSAKLRNDFESRKEICHDEMTTVLSMFEETGDIYYLATYIQVKGAHVKRAENCMTTFRRKNKKKIAKLRKHLEKVEDWGEFELALVTNCLYLFKDDFIRSITKRMLKRLTAYSKTRLNEKGLYTFLKNAAIYYIEQRSYRTAAFFVQQLSKQTTQSTQLHEKNNVPLFPRDFGVRSRKTIRRRE